MVNQDLQDGDQFFMDYCSLLYTKIFLCLGNKASRERLGLSVGWMVLTQILKSLEKLDGQLYRL